MNLLTSSLATATIISITLMTVSNFKKADTQLENITSMHSAAYMLEHAEKFTDKLKGSDKDLHEIAQANYNNIIPDNKYITIDEVADGNLSKTNR